MALVSGTVMAVKTLAKMLAKKLSKKALKKAVVKGVKKKVKGKIKDKLMGKGKKDKRQTAKNIMQQAGEFPGGGALAVSPTTALIPKSESKGGALATIDKSGGGGDGSLDFKKMGDSVDNIVGMTDAIAMLTGVEKKQAKDQADARQVAKAQAEKKAREEALEAKKGEGGPKVPGMIKKPAQGILDKMMKFLVNVALGTAILSLIKLVQNAGKIWDGIKEGFEKFFWIIRTLLWKGFIPKLFLQGVGKSIKLLGKVVKGFVNTAIAPYKAVGKTLFNAFKGATTGITKFIGNIAKAPLQWAKSIIGNMGKILSNIPGVKQAGNLVKNVGSKIGGGFKAAKSFVGGGIKKIGGGIKNVASKGLKAAKGFLGKGFKAAKGFLGLGGKAAGKTGGKVGGKILKGGLGKVAKRGALKLLGKGAVKTIGKVFGRIPVIGPLMVAVGSMLSGDPPTQTLFKAMGAALGGLVGSFIPIPILGTILGEMVGEFAGDLFYTLISGGGIEGVVAKVKKKAQQILKGGQVAGKWLGGGISRFMTNVMTTDPISIKEGRGRREVATRVSKFLGMYDWLKGLGYAGGKDGQIDKFPNILNIINPLKYAPMLVKSFFPPGEETGESGSSASLGKKEVDAGGDSVAKDDPTQEGGEDTTIIDAGSGSSGGSGGSSGGAIIVPVGSGDVLNKYYKVQVENSLYKVG